MCIFLGDFDKKSVQVTISLNLQVKDACIWPILKRSKISETEKATFTKIGLHALWATLN